jgi:hypothetical protein
VAEEEIGIGEKIVVEMLDDALLANSVEVDKDVAAEDDVDRFDKDHARVIEQIEAVELDVLAHLVAHAELLGAGDGLVIPAKGLRSDIAQRVVAVHALLGAEQGAVVEIGGDNLKGKALQETAGFFHEDDGKSIGFFSRGTPCAPDAQMLEGNFLFGTGDGRQDQALQGGELRLIAKETSLTDGISLRSRCISLVRSAERVSRS